MDVDYSIIKKYRKNANLTQTKLASLIGVSSAYIQQLENGIKTNPSLRIIYLLADVLKIPLNKLLGNYEDTLYTYVSDRLLNGFLFNNIDYANNYYIDPITDDTNHLLVLDNLLKDAIKIIMYVEDIPEEHINMSVLNEVRNLIIELIKTKSSIYKLEGNVWVGAQKYKKQSKNNE